MLTAKPTYPAKGVVISVTTTSITIKFKGGNQTKLEGKFDFKVGETIWAIYHKSQKTITKLSNDPEFPVTPPYEDPDEYHHWQTQCGFFSQWFERVDG